MKADEAAVLMQCHFAGLPGTEDPKIAKAVKYAEKDADLKAALARQRAQDERHLAELEQISVPQGLLTRLSQGEEKSVRGMGGKKALMQPVVLAIVFAGLVLLGWGGVTVWNRMHTFPGKESVVRMVEVNDDMTGMEMEQKKTTTGALNDWFFDKYQFEDYYVPPGFENYQTVGARLFKQDDEPVAQVAIDQNQMIFYSFKADDFGVTLGANDQWRIFTDGEWVAAITQHDEECFMVAFRGSRGQMESLIYKK